jgi:acetolactate synthase I/II/III large subunit
VPMNIRRGVEVMKTAEVIIKCLMEENVEVVFGYPGAAIVPVYEALRKSDIKHVLVRHEQAAGHGASGYARATGKTGVCIVTSGPGATNLITGIATAYMDSIPLVAITGQVRSSLIGKDVFQEADIIGSTASFTKHSYLVKDAKDIPRIIKEAFHIAATGRPGPVLIDIPVDIQNIEIDYNYPESVSIRGYKPTVNGHKGQIKRALDRIKKSKKPLICAGGGIISSGASEELRTFVNKSKIPVVHTLMGKEAIENTSSYYVGLIGTHGNSCANKALSEADVLIFIGTRIADRAIPGANILDKDIDIIHVDIDPAEIGKNVESMIPVVGDAKNILGEFINGIVALDTDSWIEEINEWKEKSVKRYSLESMVNPKYAVKLISDMLEEDSILVTDVGQNQFWSAHNYSIKGSRKFLTSGGLGTMGFSLPAAIGAKVGKPDSKVVAVAGDGGFQMSLPELGTIAQNNLNIIILLFNNSGLGMVREIQRNIYQNCFGVELNANPDFIKLADAYGISGKRVYSNEELDEVFNEAISSGGAYIIECIVDPSESTL